MILTMSIVRFCNAAGCRAIIPVGQYYCQKHQYLQKEYEEKHKHWQQNKYKNMTKEQRHEYNKQMYKKRMEADKNAPHEYNRFYHSYKWAQMSRRILQNQPICVSCQRKGIIRTAKVVDHITPLREDWSKRLDPDNLQPLCYHCHIIKTRKDHQREKKMKIKW